MYNTLRNCPYEFQCRGKINVKGKGEMTTFFLLDRKQSTTMRIDELHPNNSSTRLQPNGLLFGGVPTPLAYLNSGNGVNGGPPPAVPPRNPITGSGGLGHRSITMPESEPLLPPPPPPPRTANNSQSQLPQHLQGLHGLNQGDEATAWPRMVKVYPSENRRTSPVKRTHSDRVTPTREVS